MNSCIGTIALLSIMKRVPMSYTWLTAGTAEDPRLAFSLLIRSS